MIIAGIFIGFFGRKLLKPTICAVGTIVFVLLASLFLFSVMFDRDSSETWEWVIFGICCLLGIIVGVLLASLVRFGVAVLTAWGGVCLGLMLYASFVYKIDNSSQVVFWIFVILMGVLGGLLGYFAFNHAVIISTSIIGSYLLIRGFSLFFPGTFPDEALIIEQIKHGQIADFPPAFYGYLAGFIIMALGCIVT